ncbi:MAG: class I SAM-dependent methyltransferase [Nitrososphaerota archaeon]|nr:class I SAM-dependent methyltransferase [Nitrososphaerota archaeon]
METGEDYHRLKVHGPALLRAVGPVRGLKVLDLGCGQGWFSRELAARGARVVGLDWSHEMISVAKERERQHPLGIDYLKGDAAGIAKRFSRGSFDLITSCMAFMDMPGVDKVLSGASQVLRPDGRLVFSVSHPVNTSPTAHWLRRRIGRHGPWLLDGYFDEGPHDVLWKLRGTERTLQIPQWHRTFASWFRLFREGGLVVTGLWEPRPTARQARQSLGFEGVRRIPFYLIFEARPSPAGW